MDQAELKKQKTFAVVRIIGGTTAAMVLGYSYVANVLAGGRTEGALLAVGILTAAAFVYAGVAAWKLGKLMEYGPSPDES